MSDETEKPPAHLPLTVLPNSGKVEQLREELASNPPRKLNDTTIVDRVLDPSKTPTQKALEEKVIEVLKSVYDPELPVNIYELGLIYSIDVDEQDKSVIVKMTLTAPACPVAESLPREVQQKIEKIPGIAQSAVELVWDPPWTKDRMSEAALLEMGLL